MEFQLFETRINMFKHYIQRWFMVPRFWQKLVRFSMVVIVVLLGIALLLGVVLLLGMVVLLPGIVELSSLDRELVSGSCSQRAQAFGPERVSANRKLTVKRPNSIERGSLCRGM